MNGKGIVSDRSTDPLALNAHIMSADEVSFGRTDFPQIGCSHVNIPAYFDYNYVGRWYEAMGTKSFWNSNLGRNAYVGVSGILLRPMVVIRPTQVILPAKIGYTANYAFRLAITYIVILVLRSKHSGEKYEKRVKWPMKHIFHVLWVHLAWPKITENSPTIVLALFNLQHNDFCGAGQMSAKLTHRNHDSAQN